MDGVGQFAEPGKRLHAGYIISAPVHISPQSAMQEQAEIAGAIRSRHAYVRHCVRLATIVWGLGFLAPARQS